MADKIELTSEQKQAILDFWNKTPSEPPAVKDIVVHVFGQEHDHRSLEAKAVIAFLASRRLRPKPRTQTIEITEPHREYIKNNIGTMNAAEMARIIFSNPALTNLSAESRAVNEYIKSLRDDDTLPPPAADPYDIPSGEYNAPDTFHKVLKKVNFYTNLDYTQETMAPNIRKGITALMKYLATYRFVKSINSYESESDRKSLEDAFIRYTYDKSELTQEEIDQYITLAEQSVLAHKAQIRSEHLQRLLEERTSQDADSVRISMDLVEMIGKAQTEYDQIIKRQQKLFDDLTEKRSEKLSKEIRDNASVLNLIQEWKQEEYRRQYLKLVEVEAQAIEKEIDKISSMSEIKGRIFGLTKDEAKYG
jgi:hypothetical protein